MTADLWSYLLVGLGGALGSVTRFWLDLAVSNRFGRTFPFGILTINVTGCFVIGILFALIGPEGRWLVKPSSRAFFMVGICGGYTTFSSFSLDVLRLARERQWLYAGGYVALSVVLCLIAVWLGYFLASLPNPKH